MPATTASHLDDVGRVVGGLTQLGLQPVLVGGMAMVTIGRHFRDEARARKMDPQISADCHDVVISRRKMTTWLQTALARYFTSTSSFDAARVPMVMR